MSPLIGLDQPMAEVFMNLVTGASLPERGEVNVFGQPTAAIADSAEWLTVVDRFGIVTERAVFLEALTLLQNLAVPLTLDIEPLPDDVARRAAELARELDIPPSQWEQPVGALDAATRTRARIARALALDPPVILLDHPTATLDRARRRADRRARAIRRDPPRRRHRGRDRRSAVCRRGRRPRAHPGCRDRPADRVAQKSVVWPLLG